MSYTRQTDYRRKYRFDSFDFKVPEFIELLKQKAEKWVVYTNKQRADDRAEMLDPATHNKKELKEQEKQIKESPEWYAPVTISDYASQASWDCKYQVLIDPADGTFNITLRTEMNYMDKLNKGLKRKQEKEEDNANRNTSAT
jgi:hypothetical protein